MMNINILKDGCEHYKRKCKLVSPCCEQIFSCRLCHDEIKDEQELDHEKAHTLDRKKIDKIVCTKCYTKQPISNKCINCSIKFANYFCEICRLYDDVDKGQYHCSECGICRVGGKDNFFHCSECDMCLSVTLKEEHKNCNDGVYKNQCAFCQEDMFSSVKPVSSVKCGHVFHVHCLNEHFKNNNYKCPLCFKVMVDVSNMYKFMDHEIQSVQMPDEYKDVILDIFCNECNKKSKTKYHVVGLKCGECGSYNTRQ